MTARIAFTCAAWLSSEAALAACPVCFQAESGGVTEGVTAAIVVLAGVTLAVLAALGIWVRSVVHRARGAAS
jgi:uncharacterized membrane protein